MQYFESSEQCQRAFDMVLRDDDLIPNMVPRSKKRPMMNRPAVIVICAYLMLAYFRITECNHVGIVTFSRCAFQEPLADMIYDALKPILADPFDIVGTHTGRNVAHNSVNRYLVHRLACNGFKAVS